MWSDDKFSVIGPSARGVERVRQISRLSRRQREQEAKMRAVENGVDVEMENREDKTVEEANAEVACDVDGVCMLMEIRGRCGSDHDRKQMPRLTISVLPLEPLLGDRRAVLPSSWDTANPPSQLLSPSDGRWMTLQTSGRSE